MWDRPGFDQGPRGATRPAAERFAALFPLLLATMASQGVLVVLGPTIVDVGRSLDASVGAVGQARTVAAAAAISCAALVPGALGRFGLRGVLAIGVGFAVAGSAAAAAAPTLALYLAAHVALGAGLGLLLSGGFAGVAAFPTGERGWAMGYVASANALAWILANPVIGVLAAEISWRAAQLVPAVLALAALAALPWVPTLGSAPARRGALRACASERGARRWAIAEALAYCAWAGALLTYVGAFFIQRYDISEALAGVLLAGGAGAYVVASVRSGALTARFPREPLMRVAALAMSALFVVLFALDAGLALSFALFCAIALLAGVRTPASAALGMAQLPGQPATMMAVRTGVTQLGYLVGAAAAGAVLGFASYEALGAAFAVVMVASAWAMTAVPDPEAARPRAGVAAG